MRAYFGQLDGFDEGSQWAGHVEEFNKKTQWTIVFSLRPVEEFSPARDVPVSVYQQERFPRK